MLPTCLPPVSRLCVLALQYCDNVPGSTHQRPSALNLAQLHQTNKGPVRQLGSWPWLHKRVGPAAAHVHDPIHRLAPSCHTEGVHAADNTRWGAADCAQCPPRPLPIICPQHFRDACAPPHCMVVGQSIVPVRFGRHAQPWSQARSIRRGGQQTQPHPCCPQTYCAPPGESLPTQGSKDRGNGGAHHVKRSHWSCVCTSTCRLPRPVVPSTHPLT